jgi:hypothetical protein
MVHLGLDAVEDEFTSCAGVDFLHPWIDMARKTIASIFIRDLISEFLSN